MNCVHSTTINTEATRDVAGLKFEYHTKECANCRAVLWSQENDRQFQDWLCKERREHRDKFTIQKVHLPEELVSFAEELASRHLRNASSVYQACLSLYFTKPAFTERIENIEQDFIGVTKTVKFRVNPRMFIKVDANAKLFNIDKNEVAAWIIQRVLWLAKQDNDCTAEDIESILMAA